VRVTWIAARLPPSLFPAENLALIASTMRRVCAEVGDIQFEV